MSELFQEKSPSASSALKGAGQSFRASFLVQNPDICVSSSRIHIFVFEPLESLCPPALSLSSPIPDCSGQWNPSLLHFNLHPWNLFSGAEHFVLAAARGQLMRSQLSSDHPEGFGSLSRKFTLVTNTLVLSHSTKHFLLLDFVHSWPYQQLWCIILITQKYFSICCGFIACRVCRILFLKIHSQKENDVTATPGMKNIVI